MTSLKHRTLVSTFKNPKDEKKAQMITSCILLIVYILSLQYDIIHRGKKLLPKR